MNRRLITTFMLAAGFGFLTGCQSVNDRIREKPAVFAALDAATQNNIKQGIIDIGYTEDMVYLALGKPDQIRESTRTDGKTTTWIYSTYYDRYEGSAFVGYHRSVYFDPYLRAYRIYDRPAFVDAYRQEREQRIRVVFKDGKATMIEQAKD